MCQTEEVARRKQAVVMAESDGAADEVAVPPQRGRPAGDHEAKRAELLQAATAVIATEGYAKASMRRVAEYAGYTTGAVTYYFANKEDMILAMVVSRFDKYDAMLAAIRDTTDIRELLARWFELTHDAVFRPIMPELLASVRREDAVAELIARRYADFRAAYTAILETAQARGLIRADIPADVLSDQLSAMGDGWALLSPVEPDRFTPDRASALIDATVTLVSPPVRN